MKKRLIPSTRYVLSIEGLFFCLALICGSANGQQNLLKNGDFESPFPVSDPTAGWQLVFWDGRGGPGDFDMAGQSTEASVGGGGRGAHFRANHPGPAWAYFKQVVTNLTEGAIYTLTIQKMKFLDANHDKQLSIYMAAISGSSSNFVYGYTTNGIHSLSITCSATRQIEVQLQYNKKTMPTPDSADDFKSSETGAHYDECSLVLTP